MVNCLSSEVNSDKITSVEVFDPNSNLVRISCTSRTSHSTLYLSMAGYCYLEVSTPVSKYDEIYEFDPIIRVGRLKVIS